MKNPIAITNDKLRAIMVPMPNLKIVISPIVSYLTFDKLMQLLIKISEFDDFDSNDDRHERGLVEFNEYSYLWDIAYFGHDPESEDCIRVITVMRSDENQFHR